MSIAEPKSAEVKAVTIRVLDKEYQIACPTDEQEALLDSARLLDEKMREIRDSRKMVGTEQVAIIAALNMAHDLLSCQSGGPSKNELTDSELRSLQTKVEAAIARGRQLVL